jgi:signal transduction histidine kinase
MARRNHSISLPITMGVSSVGLCIAMLFGWIVVILQNNAFTREGTQNTWLMISGIVSLGVIIAVLVLFSVFLTRETLEIRRQDTFIDSVTHELKSPLASLKLCLETLARSALIDEQREELRRMMLDDVDRLHVFIDDILDASRVTHGRQSLSLSDVSLHSMIDHCADTVRKRYRLDSGAIVIDTPADLHLITDRTALETILKNLLDNAVKYSGEHVQVRVETALLARNMLQLDVIDHGIGIRADHLRRVFERFYRVPTEDVRSRRGTGLGLYVVSALARSLKGHVEVYSAGKGQGTRLRVVVPIQGGEADA